MAKIKLSEPDGPYECAVDTGVMNVEIQEAYKAVEFLSNDQEQLDVFMRDTGYEVIYNAPDPKESVIIELKGGNVYINGGQVHLGFRA